MRGGFVGVDVFFVISGYLISTIIFGSLDRGEFDFLDFYRRRIRRIFPALIVVLSACLAAGWGILLADEYRQLGKHVAGGAGFVANLVLWREAGYFDVVSDLKPLLHLWSLGIEEQFYLVWPAIVWAVWKVNLNRLTVLVLLMGLSFFANIHGVTADAFATFYGPHSRFWELLFGALLAHASLSRGAWSNGWLTAIDGRLAKLVYREPPTPDGSTLANCLSLLGFAALIFGLFRINQTLEFPGKWALLPVLGTTLIIAGGSNAWVNRVILSNRILVWFGLISFPLYLWHWPLLSFARILHAGVPDRSVRVILILCSILLAWLTFRFVERPVRKAIEPSKGRHIAHGLVVAMVAVCAASFGVYSEGGFPSRMVKFEASAGWDDSGQSLQEPIWKFGNRRSTKRLLAFGDSHINHVSRQIREQFGRDYAIDFVNFGSCFMGDTVTFPTGLTGDLKDLCEKRVSALRSMRGQHYDAVITAQRWHMYGGGTGDETLNVVRDRMQAFGIRFSKLVVLGSTPTIDFNCEKSKVRPVESVVSCPAAKDQAVVKRFMESTERMPKPANVFFVYPYRFLCPDDKCVVIHDGISNYADETHLSYEGGRPVVDVIAKIVREQ